MLEKYSKTVVIGIYCIFAILIYVLFATLGDAFTLFGHKIDLLPVIVSSVALLDGSLAGAVCGFFIGILYDINSVNADGLFPIFFMFFGGFAGVISKKYLLKILPSAIILTVTEFFMLAILRGLSFYILYGGIDFRVFLGIFFAETIVALIFSPVVYYPIRYFSRVLNVA